MILIAEKDTVYDKFPTPLINRLEKHFVLTSSILKEWQEIVLRNFEDWISKFSDSGYVLLNIYCHNYVLNISPSIFSISSFKKQHAFIGFQKDTPASVVFQASNLLRSATAAGGNAAGGNVTGYKWEEVFWWCGLELDLRDIREDQDSTAWNQAVSFLISQFMSIVEAVQ